jgi:hypothetical protein
MPHPLEQKGVHEAGRWSVPVRRQEKHFGSEANRKNHSGNHQQSHSPASQRSGQQQERECQRRTDEKGPKDGQPHRNHAEVTVQRSGNAGESQFVTDVEIAHYGVSVTRLRSLRLPDQVGCDGVHTAIRLIGKLEWTSQHSLVVVAHGDREQDEKDEQRRNDFL